MTYPAPGVISVFDPLDQVGRIVLESGEELRFGGSACVAFVPVAGLRVFVIAAAPHPLGGQRATIVNTSGAPDEDRITIAEKKNAEDERARLAYLATEQRRREALALHPSPRKASRTDARVAGVLDELDALRAARIVTAATAKRIRLEHDLGLEDFEWCLDAFTAEPLDPCFLAFGGADGDYLGVYLYPPALDAGEPSPVLYYFHEQDPVFTPVAASLGSFADLLRQKKRRGTISPATLGPLASGALEAVAGGPADDDERTLVRGLFQDPQRRPALESLASLLDARSWSFQAAACRYRIAAL